MTSPPDGHDDDGDQDWQQSLFDAEPEPHEHRVRDCIARLRDLGYQVRPPNTRHTFRVRSDAPVTSKMIEPILRADSLAEKIYLQFFAGGGEYTCDEIERVTGRSHQSTSAAVNGLMRRGLIADSGRKRRTRYGNWAILWKRTRRSPRIKGTHARF